MTAPAAKEDVDTLWEHHNTLRQEHQQLRVEHTELKGAVETIRHMIQENRDTRDAQHKELMDVQRDNAKKLSALKTEEDKRDGMVRLGKYAAAVLAALGTIVVIGFTLYKLIKGIAS